jgi:hypothetical protein
MSLEYCSDVAPATGIAESDTEAMQLICFGPSGYEAYARVRFIPDPVAPGQAEADAPRPDPGSAANV